MPIHPSPCTAARRTAASERPPTISGTGVGGAGAISASSTSTNSPWNVTGLPVMQLAHHREALVHAAPARRRVDAAHRVLVRVLAADPDTEDQPSGREQLEVGELTGHQRGVPQREQVHRDVDGHRRVDRGERRGAHQTVEARAHEEAHVIAGTDVVETGIGRAVDELGLRARVRTRTLQRRERAHPDRRHQIRLSSSSMNLGTGDGSRRFASVTDVAF